MLSANSDMQEATAVDFFSRMDAEGVDYAVLRNYELYPQFGHDIDLVVRRRDLSKWRDIAKSCAKNHGWMALTECGHWARSSSGEHNIHILRFYSADPLRYLQMDAFHSLLILGVPLFDEDTLLRERIRDHRGFYRIDERIENFYRFVQIAKLAGMRGTEEKLERYSRRALSFWEETPDLTAFAEAAGFPYIWTAFDHLRSGDFERFKSELDRQKRAWLLGRVHSEPIRTGRMIFDRVVDCLRLFWLRPCGFDIRAFASDEGQRKRLKETLEKLTRANVITSFTLSRGFKERQRARERGGITVDWAPAKRANIIMGCEADEQSAMNALLKLIIERHPRLLDQRTGRD